jgi:predicted Fe-S protein YdhL (DUF1289 family)
VNWFGRVGFLITCVGGRVVCHRQLPEVVLIQFVSPDDEHDVLETCRELKIKINTQKRIVRHVGHLPRINFSCLLLYEKHKS